MPFVRKANVDKIAHSKDRAELTRLWYLGSLKTKILKDCTRQLQLLGGEMEKTDLGQKTNEKVLVIAAYENSCTILPMWYCSTLVKCSSFGFKSNGFIVPNISRNSALTSSYYFHNYHRFSLVAGETSLFATKIKLRTPKKIAKIKEQDAISSLLESLGKEHHVFSHLCRSFAYCSVSKFKGEGTPGILVQNKMLYSTSKKISEKFCIPILAFHCRDK